MVTSPVPAVCTTRGMPFAPTNGVAAVHRRQAVEVQIQEARRQAEEEQSKWTRTSKRKTRGRS